MNIQVLLDKIKTARKLRFLTNCYSLDVINKAERLWEKEDSFAFTYNDNGINRLIFFVNNYKILECLLGELEKGQYFLEIMTKNLQEDFPSNLNIVAKMMRMATSDCSSVFNNSSILQYRDDSKGTEPDIDDAHEINEILWNTFHTEISHLLTDEEIVEKIKRGKFLIHRSKRIDAVLQTDVMPKKFYINQIVNLTDKKIIHAILLKRLWNYIQNGGSYAYAWVEDKNIASVKFHEKYGFKHDGMWNLVFGLNQS